MKAIYPNIDMIKTGQKIKEYIRNAGYSVKDIQNLLNLSCPQPIYRWFKGQILPSVDHLYTLSLVLGIHMEEMIVSQQEPIVREGLSGQELRVITYYKMMKKVA